MRRLRQLYDASTAGNANLDFTATTGKTMRLLFGQVRLTTDATVANRRVIISVIDPDSNEVISLHSGAVVTASSSDQHHEFMQGIYRETSFIGDTIQVPIPYEMFIPPGYTLRISVENGVAGDDFVTNLIVEE